MKAKLEFDLDNIEERQEHKRCIKATDAYIVFNKIDNYLRGLVKYRRGIDLGDVIHLEDGPYKINSYESELLHYLAESIRAETIRLKEEHGIDENDLS
jgi:hypothetical protein